MKKTDENFILSILRFFFSKKLKKVESVEEKPKSVEKEKNLKPIKIDKEPVIKPEPMDMYNLTVEQLIDVVGKKGHTVFKNDTKDYNINYIGVRSKNRTPNAFDDMFYIFWKYQGKWTLIKHTGTTDPGTYYLEDPCNVEGTAILKPGQYRGCWKKGLHQGKYDALVQKLAVTVLRDDDEDNELDFNTEKEETGFFGINHHRANSKYESTQVDRWSAGCQVRNDPEEYSEFMEVVDKACEIWGDSYTYTLIEEKDLETT